MLFFPWHLKKIFAFPFLSYIYQCLKSHCRFLVKYLIFLPIHNGKHFHTSLLLKVSMLNTEYYVWKGSYIIFSSAQVRVKYFFATLDQCLADPCYSQLITGTAQFLQGTQSTASPVNYQCSWRFVYRLLTQVNGSTDDFQKDPFIRERGVSFCELSSLNGQQGLRCKVERLRTKHPLKRVSVLDSGTRKLEVFLSILYAQSYQCMLQNFHCTSVHHCMVQAPRQRLNSCESVQLPHVYSTRTQRELHFCESVQLAEPCEQ